MSALTNKRPQPNVYPISAKGMAKRIGIPLDRWPGNCFTVACALVDKKGGVDGDAVYGHWTGPVAPGTMFHGKPLIQHGWVLRSDGTVVDPTRFVFEGAEPYIYEGPADYYDEGGNAWRKAMLSPAPDFNEKLDNPNFMKLVKWKPKNQRLARAVDILLEPAKRKVGFLSRHQLFWLANLPYEMLTPVPGLDLAPDLYKELGKLGLEVAVPLDNRRRAERKHVRAAR